MALLLHTRTRLDELKPEFIVKMSLSTSDVEAVYREIKAKGAVPNGEIEHYPPDHRYFRSMIQTAIICLLYNP